MSVERIYLARFLTRANSLHVDNLLEMGRQGRILSLESFYDSNNLIKIFEYLPEVKVFLDSGAYSLDNQGVENTDKYLDDYINFILKYEDRLFVYVNLDNIRDTNITWKNQKYMEERGLQPMPVYHYEDDFKWLEKCVNEYDYVGIGGIAKGLSKEADRILFDKIFDYMYKKNLSTKIHAFGMTKFRFMTRYPWYSVDSTTWLKFANFGKVIIPRYDVIRQKFNYFCTPIPISVSDISEVKSDTDNTHYSLVYPPRIVERIEEYFTMIGIDSEKLKTESSERYTANAYYYEQFSKDERFHQLTEYKGDKSFF